MRLGGTTRPEPAAASTMLAFDVVRPLRLLVYDRTCRGHGPLPGLSHAWWTGRWFYRALGRLDGALAADSWQQALEWLASTGADAPIAEVQFWGHGRWGNARIGDEILDVRSLDGGHHHHQPLLQVRQRLRPGAAGLWWFRTCETYGTDVGKTFAKAWTSFLGCRTAGHTHVIGFWQSGLHSLLPDAEPGWASNEGLVPSAIPRAEPTAAVSHRRAPNTITCLEGRVPEHF